MLCFLSASLEVQLAKRHKTYLSSDLVVCVVHRTRVCKELASDLDQDLGLIVKKFTERSHDLDQMCACGLRARLIRVVQLLTFSFLASVPSPTQTGNRKRDSKEVVVIFVESGDSFCF